MPIKLPGFFLLLTFRVLASGVLRAQTVISGAILAGSSRHADPCSLQRDHEAARGGHRRAAPRLSAKWKYSLSDETALHLSGGTGFRVVNVFTGDHTALTGAREAVFAERLEPERSYNLTASVQQILPFGTSPLTLDLDGCYTHFSDRIILDYDQNPNLIVYGNLSGHSVSHGVAINLSQNFTRLPITYTAGFTLLAVYVEEGGRRRVVAYAPASRLSCSVSYALDRLDATLDYTATLTGRSGFRMPTVALGRPAESPAFTGYTVRSVGSEIYASVENLFNYTQGSSFVAADDPFGDDFDTAYT